MHFGADLAMLTMCRQVKEGDDVEQGVGGNSILQRLKLNSKVALITGETFSSPK